MLEPLGTSWGHLGAVLGSAWKVLRRRTIRRGRGQRNGKCLGTFLGHSSLQKSFPRSVTILITKIGPKSMENQSKFMQHPSNIKQNNTQERSESDLGSKSVPGYEKGATVFEKWVPFERHLGDFRRHFVPSWAPRGSQNQAFWHQVALKSQKMTS